MALYADEAAALADGCIHYWPMDGSAGAEVVQDRIGSFHGKVTSNFTHEAAETIQASPLSFCRKISHHGTTQDDLAVLQFDPSEAGLFSTAFYNASFRIRVYFDALSGEVDFVWMGLDPNGNGGVRLYAYNGEIYLLNSSGNITAPLTIGQWHEIVVVCWDGGGSDNIELYVDGSLAGSIVRANANFNPYEFTVGIGGRRGFANEASYALEGSVDEVAFWNRRLLAAEITSLYNSGASVSLLDYVAPPAPPVTEINPQGVIRFYLVLTGVADSQSDIRLPMSSFAARIYSGSPSSVTAIVPNGAQFSEAISLRPNGDLVILQSIDGVESELARVGFSELRSDEGSRSGLTLTLTGSRQEIYDSAALFSLEKPSYVSQRGQRYQVRGPALAVLKPTDLVNVRGKDIEVDTITFIGSANRVYMEIGGNG
jgi:hypothetical protein